MSTTPKNLNENTIIYVLKDPETKEIRYVGKTVSSLQKRLKQHIYDTKKSKNHRSNWIKSILNKNLIPEIEEIDNCIWLESQEKEQFWIKYYKDLNYNLVNATDGGEGNLGYVKSKETIQKLKDSLRKNSPKVYQYDLNGLFIKEWLNIQEAAETLNIKSTGIRRNAIGERNKYKEFIWSFEKKDSIKNYNREYKSTNKGGYTQSKLSRLIKQEEANLLCNNVFIYDNDNLLYEAISLTDAVNYLKNILHWTQTLSTLKNAICQSIKSKSHYNNLYFTYDIPENHNCKSGKLLHLTAYDFITNDLLFEEDGLNDFCNKFGLNKTNVINNIKGKTKSLIYNNTKIKIKYCPINEQSLIWIEQKRENTEM